MRVPVTMAHKQTQGRTSLFVVVGRPEESRWTKIIRKRKRYELMMPIYIYCRLGSVVAFNAAMTDRLLETQPSRRFAL